VIIYTPSKYVLHGATRWLPGWKRGNWRTRGGKLVKNREVWEALDHAMNAHAITWHFLSRDERGEHSEKAAQAARREAERMIEEKTQSG
jgi:ribonuclease HI